MKLLFCEWISLKHTTPPPEAIHFLPGCLRVLVVGVSGSLSGSPSLIDSFPFPLSFSFFLSLPPNLCLNNSINWLSFVFTSFPHEKVTIKLASVESRSPARRSLARPNSMVWHCAVFWFFLTEQSNWINHHQACVTSISRRKKGKRQTQDIHLKMRSWILVMLIAFVAYLFFIKLNKWKPGGGIKLRKMTENVGN